MGVGPATATASAQHIGLLGGSFDPVHRAHLALAQAALQGLALDAVWWIPAGEPWQRPPLGATAEQRLQMLHLALGQQPAMQVLTLETERTGPTYTAETLTQLLAAAPAGTRFTWLLGTDQLQNFCTWQDWPGIVERVDLAVAQRPGTAVRAPEPLQQQLALQGRVLHEVPFAPLDISATEIRQRCQRGLPIRHLVPEVVADYIQQHQLYLTAPA